MATNKPKRTDWIAIEDFDANGAVFTRWRHKVTGNMVNVPHGTHPMDNPNSIQAFSDSPETSLAPLPDENFFEEPETSEERVASMLSGVSASNAVIHVYKILENGKLAACTKMQPEEFEVGWTDGIRNRFGSGEYQIRLYPTGGNRRGCLAKQDVTILPDLNPPPKQNSSVTGDPAILEMLRAMNARIDSLAQSPPRDTMEDMGKMFSMMKLMREAMGERPHESPMEMVRELLGTVQAAKQLREAIEVPETPENPLFALAPKALDVIQMALSQQGQNPAPVAQTGQVLPMAAVPATLLPNPSENITVPMQTEPQPQPQPQPQTGEVPPVVAQFQAALDQVNRLAFMRMPPENAADLIYGQISSNDDSLFELLQRPEWFDVFKQIHPGVASYPEWYAKVREELLSSWNEERSESATKQDSPAS